MHTVLVWLFRLLLALYVVGGASVMLAATGWLGWDSFDHAATLLIPIGRPWNLFGRSELLVLLAPQINIAILAWLARRTNPQRRVARRPRHSPTGNSSPR